MLKSQNQQEIDCFLNTITNLRKSLGYSKKRMAEILGIGIASLNKIESGELPQKLKVNIVFRIEEKFNISASEQFKGK